MLVHVGSCWFYLLEVPGSTWQYLAVPGSTWQYLAVPGSTWQYLAVPGSTWQYLAVPGSTWQYLAVPGSTWQYLAVPGSTWQYLAVPGSTWQYLAVPGSTWQYLAVPGSTWQYLAVPGSTWQYLAVPGSTWYPSLQNRQRLLASSSSRLPSKAWRSHGLFGAKAVHALTVVVGSCALLLKSRFQLIPDYIFLYIPIYSTIQQSTIDNSHKSALCFLTWEGMDGAVVLPLQI